MGKEKYREFLDSINSGKFNLKIIYSKESPTDKWITWKRNIDQNALHFKSIVDFRDKNWYMMFEDHNIERQKKWLSQLMIDHNNNNGCSSNIYDSDANRKPNITEYLILGEILRKHNIIYNKKKDEFIKLK